MGICFIYGGSDEDYNERFPKACCTGAATGAMGQPTPAPPPDLTEPDALSYIDPGYKLLEKVRG